MNRSFHQLEDIYFSPPLNINGEKVKSRSGIIIEESKQLAEIPYIPHLHIGSKEELYDQVQKWQKGETLKQIFPHFSFALSQLELCQSGSIKKSKLQEIKLQGYLNKENPDFSQNLSVYKIKINPQNLSLDILSLQHLFEKAPTNTLFRLDANRTFTLNSFYSYWEKIKKYREKIDYFEEPLSNYREYHHLESLGVPYALDESTALYLKGNTSFSPKALVLKPSLFGDLRVIQSTLSKLEIPIIISSTYESSIGLLGSYWLAQFYPQMVHGLDTAKLHQTQEYTNL